MPILTVKTRYLEAIRNGQKTSTIRLPPSRIAAGETLTFTNYRVSVRVRCIDVTETTVDRLTEQQAHADGFRDRAALMRALREHYPTLAADAAIIVVRFERFHD